MDILMALDVGTIDVKAVYYDGRFQGFKFPSAVTLADSLIDNLSIRESGDAVAFNGETLIIGERAIEKSFPNSDLEFLSKYSPPLAFKAIHQIREATGRTVEGVVIGIPLANYTREKIESVKHSLSSFVADEEGVDLDVVVLPQGYGTLLDYMYGENGELLEERRNHNLLVLDIGGNTTDVVYADRGKARRESSGRLQIGNSKIVSKLRTTIQAEYSVDLPSHPVSRALAEGSLKFYGIDVSLSINLHTLVDSYLEEVLSSIESLYGSSYLDTDAWVIGGGGSYILKNYLSEKYKSKILFLDEPEYANARGFLKSVTHIDTEA